MRKSNLEELKHKYVLRKMFLSGYSSNDKLELLILRKKINRLTAEIELIHS